MTAPDPTAAAEIEILLEDGPAIAVNKPAGLPSQSSNPEIPSVEGQVKEYLRRKYDKPGNVYLGIPHRLDRPVSGVMLLARNSKAAARLSEQFAERQVTKIYWAVLAGHLPQPRGMLVDSVRKVPDQPRAEVVEDDAEDAKDARLTYRVLQTWTDAESGADRTLVEVQLLTGRMHQIRLQFGSRGFPIVGDTLYGAAESAPPNDADARAQPILLHARQLTFLHPIRYDEVTVTAPLPACWPAAAHK